MSLTGTYEFEHAGYTSTVIGSIDEERNAVLSQKQTKFWYFPECAKSTDSQNTACIEEEDENEVESDEPYQPLVFFIRVKYPPINHRRRYPKTRVFNNVFMHCSQTKIETLFIKRIGGNYPYGPKMFLVLQQNICYNYLKTIASTARLDLIKRDRRRHERTWNKIWCNHCISYWKKVMGEDHQCCAAQKKIYL
ncbi:unnamed protein product [Caenorhabditis sp. 36 PRJEB53466]|nr:unnamed protein product [Caenorhabditis sp. 36 PRJEB53466]